MNNMNSMNNNNAMNMGMHNGHHPAHAQNHYIQMNQNSHSGGGGGHFSDGHHYLSSMNSYSMYPDVNVGHHEDPDQGQMSGPGGHMIPSPGMPCGVGGGLNGYPQGPYDYIPKLTHL